MYLDTIPYAGMPLRGSIQDRVACEMLLRRRRQEVNKFAYLGRIVAATVQLPEIQYQFLTELLAFEVFHENYNPEMFETKQEILKSITESPDKEADERKRMFKALKNLELAENDMRPVTPEYLEQVKRRLRKRKLQQASKVVKPHK